MKLTRGGWMKNSGLMHCPPRRVCILGECLAVTYLYWEYWFRKKKREAYELTALLTQFVGRGVEHVVAPSSRTKASSHASPVLSHPARKPSALLRPHGLLAHNFRVILELLYDFPPSTWLKCILLHERKGYPSTLCPAPCRLSYRDPPTVLSPWKRC